MVDSLSGRPKNNFPVFRTGWPAAERSDAPESRHLGNRYALPPATRSRKVFFGRPLQYELYRPERGDRNQKRGFYRPGIRSLTQNLGNSPFRGIRGIRRFTSIVWRKTRRLPLIVVST